jgi:CMP-2-keto-3-deoxyoctulosonic acid synthetase
VGLGETLRFISALFHSIKIIVTVMASRAPAAIDMPEDLPAVNAAVRLSFKRTTLTYRLGKGGIARRPP